MPSVLKTTHNFHGYDDYEAGDVVWATWEETNASDDVYATSATTASAKSKLLRITGWGFALPANALVTGVEFKVEAKSENAAHQFRNVFIGNGIGNYSGDLCASEALTASDAIYTFGGPTSLGGWTYLNLPYGDINSNNFGFWGSFLNTDGSNTRTVSVDHVTVEVFYTLVTGANSLMLKGSGS